MHTIATAVPNWEYCLYEFVKFAVYHHWKNLEIIELNVLSMEPFLTLSWDTLYFLQIQEKLFLDLG